MSSKIIFFGNERLSTGYAPNGAPTLQSLIENGYKIAAVVASHSDATSRQKRKLEVQEIAIKHNIPVILPERVKNIAEELKQLKPDIGILVAFGQIIPQSIIDIFPRGIINIHPSLLPKYRGPTPIEQAILDGAQKTGVSIMGLTKAMDTGPIFDQQELELTGNESKQDITQKLHQIGAALIIKNLPSILNGNAQPTVQDESQVTYCSLITKTYGILNLKKPAIQLEREIRAFQGWPKSRTTVFNKEIIVKNAEAVNQIQQKELILHCAKNSFLKINQLIGPSGKQMSGSDFIKGYNKT